MKHLQTALPQIQSLRDVPPDEFAKFRHLIPEIPRRRAQHVVDEMQRVESAQAALQNKDRQALGSLLYAGHASLRDLYEVSTPELDCLVDLSRGIDGCLGARLTGAGFGGCTINMVESSCTPDFGPDLKRRYKVETGRNAVVYPCMASEGAHADLL